MVCSEAEDAGGLTPAKDDNEAARHFTPELYRFSTVSTILFLCFNTGIILSKCAAGKLVYPMDSYAFQPTDIPVPLVPVFSTECNKIVAKTTRQGLPVLP